MKTAVIWLLALSLLFGCRPDSNIDSTKSRTEMTLEQQLKALGELGLALNEGVTIDDLLYSWDREEYEKEPFDVILFTLGSEVEREPWERPVCDTAWNFDVECIEDTGDYVTIVKQLCRVAGMPNLISDAEDFVDIENGKAWLKYTIDGKQRQYTIAVDNDWADPDTVSAVMADIERDGNRFYAKDNGQASIWFYLDEQTAGKLNQMTGNALNR